MKDRHCFTLIELLVVIAIIAILAAMLMPALQQARMRGQSIKCISNLKQQGVAVALYEDANGGWFPIATELDKNGMYGLINGKYLTLKVLDCPADATRTPPKDFRQWDWLPEEDQGFNRSYVIDAWLGQTMSGVFLPAYKPGIRKTPFRMVAIFCSDPCYLNAQTAQPVCWSRGHCNWENHITPETHDGTAAGLAAHAGNRNILTIDGGAITLPLTMVDATNKGAFNWHPSVWPKATVGSVRYYQQ